MKNLNLSFVALSLSALSLQGCSSQKFSIDILPNIEVLREAEVSSSGGSGNAPSVYNQVSKLDLGRLEVGQTKTIRFALTNSGDFVSTIKSLSISNSYYADTGQISLNHQCSVLKAKRADQCLVTVTFNPREVANFTPELVAETTKPDGSSKIFKFAIEANGFGVARLKVIDGGLGTELIANSSLSFGSIMVGDSKNKLVKIETNTNPAPGNTLLKPFEPAKNVSIKFGGEPFSLVAPTSSQLPAGGVACPLAGNSSITQDCYFYLKFSPTQVTTSQSVLALQYDNGTGNVSAPTVALSGSGSAIPIPPNLTSNSNTSPLDFGSVVWASQASNIKPSTVRVSVEPTGSVYFDSFASLPSGVVLLSDGPNAGTCPTTQNQAFNSACYFEFAYQPEKLEEPLTQTAISLNFKKGTTSATSVALQVASVKGRAINPAQVSVDGLAQIRISTKVFKPYTSSITFKNNGDAPATILSRPGFFPSISGLAFNWTKSATDLTACTSLNPGDTCLLQISYSPQSAMAATLASFSFSADVGRVNTETTSQAITFIANGDIEFDDANSTPGPISFGNVMVNGKPDDFVKSITLAFTGAGSVTPIWFAQPQGFQVAALPSVAGSIPTCPLSDLNGDTFILSASNLKCMVYLKPTQLALANGTAGSTLSSTLTLTTCRDGSLAPGVSCTRTVSKSFNLSATLKPPSDLTIMNIGSFAPGQGIDTYVSQIASNTGTDFPMTTLVANSKGLFYLGATTQESNANGGPTTVGGYFPVRITGYRFINQDVSDSKPNPFLFWAASPNTPCAGSRTNSSLGVSITSDGGCSVNPAFMPYQTGTYKYDLEINYDNGQANNFTRVLRFSDKIRISSTSLAPAYFNGIGTTSNTAGSLAFAFTPHYSVGLTQIKPFTFTLKGWLPVSDTSPQTPSVAWDSTTPRNASGSITFDGNASGTAGEDPSAPQVTCVRNSSNPPLTPVDPVPVANVNSLDPQPPQYSCTVNLRFTASAFGDYSRKLVLSYKNGFLHSGVSGADTSGVYKYSVTISASAKAKVPLLALNSTNACILDQQDRATCFGSNTPALLGPSVSPASGVTSSLIATYRPNFGESPFVWQTSFGNAFACARVSNSDPRFNRLTCWGDNTYGQLGQENTTPSWSPFLVPQTASTSWVKEMNLGYSNYVSSQFLVKDFSVGLNHACAILGLSSSGIPTSVKCWGQSVIDGTTLGDQPNEMGNNLNSISLSKDAIQIVSGYKHVCVLLTDSTVQCWGANDVGQIDPTVAAPRAAVTTPKAMNFGLVNGESVKSLVSTRTNRTCAIIQNSSGASQLKCIGPSFTTLTAPQGTTAWAVFTSGDLSTLEINWSSWKVVSAAVGNTFACAVLANATANSIDGYELVCKGSAAWLPTSGGLARMRSGTNSAGALQQAVSVYANDNGMGCYVTNFNEVNCFGAVDSNPGIPTGWSKPLPASAAGAPVLWKDAPQSL